MSPPVSNLSLTIFFGLLLFSGCKFGVDEEVCVDEPVVEEVAPKKVYDPEKEILAISTLDKEPFPISDLKGPAFINLWATWCLPCILEFPSIQEMKGEMEEEGWSFLFVSTENISKIKKFQKENESEFDFDYYHMSKKFRDYGVTNIPFTYIINSEGEVVMNYQGAMDWSTEQNKNDLRELVKEKNPN